MFIISQSIKLVFFKVVPAGLLQFTYYHPPDFRQVLQIVRRYATFWKGTD